MVNTHLKAVKERGIFEVKKQILRVLAAAHDHRR
jgi:hypothetical protein